jgi:tetratricopeptide (TPR) repeat protein
MAQGDVYDRIFEYPQTDVAQLVLTNPDEIEQGAQSREIAAWQMLLGSMRLRRAGQRSPANDWLNHATHLSVKVDILTAELLGEAGQALYESDRLQDAYQTLNSAVAIWRDVCEQAAQACKTAKTQASEFASHLLPIFAAAKIKPPVVEAPISSGPEAVAMVQQWLSDRAVTGRAQATNAFVRVLARARQIEDARGILKDEIQWVTLNFLARVKPMAKQPSKGRMMSRPTRRALYLLLLAQGEIELAAEEFQASADGFRAAADMYEGQAEDESDINRLLRAKFNEANSLLRLNRIREAVNIYELCRHGFNSIGEDEAAQRVDHAIVYTRSMAEDDDES